MLAAKVNCYRPVEMDYSSSKCCIKPRRFSKKVNEMLAELWQEKLMIELISSGAVSLLLT